MNVCAVTRLLVPASFMAVAVSLFAGDRWGLTAAAVTVAVLYVAGKVRGTSQACGIPGSSCEVPTGKPAAIEDPVVADEHVPRA
jgi:hypothetical protein